MMNRFHVWGKMALAVACHLLLAGSLMAQPLGDGFGGRLEQAIVNAKQLPAGSVSLVAAPGIEGNKALRIAQQAKVQFHDVPIEADTKYMLTMRARFEGGESAEENPHFARFAMPGGQPAVVSTREMLFLDENKAVIETIRVGMPWRAWTPYTDVFYPPANARYMRLAIQAGSNGITLLVDDVKLAPAPDEKAINPNPVLGQYGAHNYSGWRQFARAALMVTLPDGQVALDTKYGTIGRSFPISQPGEYEISVVSEPNGYNYSFVLRLVDKDNKPTGEVSVWGHGRPLKFNLPPGTQRGYFVVYSSILKEVRVRRAGA